MGRMVNRLWVQVVSGLRLGSAIGTAFVLSVLIDEAGWL